MTAFENLLSPHSSMALSAKYRSKIAVLDWYGDACLQMSNKKIKKMEKPKTNKSFCDYVLTFLV